MRLRVRIYFLLLGLATFAGTSCNLEKEIDIDLPTYEKQMVVECYLEQGKPARLTLLESTGYLEAPSLNLIEDATVTISHHGLTENLTYQPALDRNTGKYYTHTSDYLVQGQPGDVFALSITDPKGRKLTGTTTILPPVPIDTVEFNFNDRNQALIVTKFKDDANTANFYRYSIHRDSLEGETEISYTASDELNNGEPFVFGTGYDFETGDSVIVTLQHLDQAFFDFQESVEEAKDANGNPFAQPGRVKSTVQGGLGVFTNLVYDRRKLVVPPKK
ncbi:DUF4249 domain-containing protein [Adhaeribacter pallidiroseus]|uniref:DUF4249 domain-containing protein n=1 Tax=Adhaeribacter pallidiroseus TaxID=2072847 RepID=A0A369QCE5_9BACT|nr:DUF4249 domain-containing protein [Adhaeribacter pallidiroseus]RDC62112.1 hypothetical protein AHMF7616_00703 [Adhaeribacter pallidiroseus]